MKIQRVIKSNFILIFGALVLIASLMLMSYNLGNQKKSEASLKQPDHALSPFELIYAYEELADGFHRMSLGDDSISLRAISSRYEDFRVVVQALTLTHNSGEIWLEHLSSDVGKLQAAAEKLEQLLEKGADFDLTTALWETEVVRPSVISIGKAFEQAHALKDQLMRETLTRYYLESWFLIVVFMLIFGGFVFKLVVRNRELQAHAGALSAREAQLKEMSHYRQQFLANMSHEFRTPLNAIQGFSQAILYQKGNLPRDQILSYVELIEKSARDLGGLTSNVLDLSRVDGGNFELHLDETPLTPLIKGAIAQCMPLAVQYGITVRHYISDSWMVRCDSMGIKRCVTNALTNAIKYSEPDQAVDLFAYHREDDKLVIEVRDRGCGIPEKEMDGIWTAYARSSVTRKSDREGAGLGLPIIKSLVDAHNGNIELESREGEGTTIRLCFPGSMIVPSKTEPEEEAPNSPVNARAVG